MSIGNWYRVGTVSVQNGNVNIVGTNTFWMTQCNPGDRFTVDGENWYEIITITDDTHLSIESVGGSGAFAGATAANLPYAVDRNFNNALSGGLAAQVAALLAQFQAGANGPLSGLFQNGSAATPGIAFLNEASTGLFRPAAGIAALAVQGAEFLRAVGTVNGVPAMLGLGTAAPAQMVDLAGSNSALWGVRMTNGSVGTGARSGFIASNGTQNLNIGVNGANFTANGVLAPSRGFVEGPAGIDFASGVTAGNAFSWGVGAGYASKMAMDYQGNVTLTGGAVTFADGSSISSAGWNNLASYTSVSASPLNIQPTINANTTGTFQAVTLSPTLVPIAGTIANAICFSPTVALGSSSNNVSKLVNSNISMLINSSYAGTVAAAASIAINHPNNQSANAIGTWAGILFNNATSNGSGITAGTVTNNGVQLIGFTGGAGAGGTVVNTGIYAPLSVGSGAGITSNYGVWITGNGGSGGSGTTNNWALYSDSTAPSYLAGNLLLGVTSGATHTIAKALTADAGNAALVASNGTNSTAIFYSVSGAGYNAGNAALKIGKDGTTGYSLRPGGTVASPGADYAEYRQLVPALYGAVAKGALLGYDINGLMTNVFANVVGRVLPKSTNPSYVGADTWGVEATIVAAYGVVAPGDAPAEVLVPVAPAAAVAPGVAPTVVPVPVDSATQDEIAAYEAYLAAQEAYADAVEAFAVYENALALFPQWQASYATYQTDVTTYEAGVAAFNAALETERLKWDRVALCGVVPVNLAGLTAADVGKYLVPCAAADGTISATAVTKGDLTLGQYIDSFGSIEAIGADGRPLVNVKNG